MALATPSIFQGFGAFYGNRLAVYSFGMGFLASSFFLHSRGIFFPVWMAEFEADKTQISLVISVVLFTGSISAPIFGYCLDRFPWRNVVCLGAIWMALGYCLLQWADTYVAFFAILLLFQSFGWECIGPLAQTKLMVNWFSRNRGMALGVAIMGISVAGVVMPTLVTGLLERFGWQDTYLVYASLLLLVVVPVTWFLVKQQPSDVGQYPDGVAGPAAVVQAEDGIEAEVQGDVSEQVAPLTAVSPSTNTATSASFDLSVYREFLGSKAFWSVVLTFGLMNGVYSAMITHLPTYLTQELDFSLYDASYVLGTAGAFSIGGKLVFGYLMDHMNAKRAVLGAILSYFMSTLVFMRADNLSLLMIAAALFGLGFGGMVPVRSVLLSRLFGVTKFSRANGLMTFFLAPATFWVLITGVVADSSGTYVSAFQIWAGAFLLAGVVTSLIDLPNPEQSR